MSVPSWICCQRGAREHYSVPYAAHANRDLALLITEAWADRFPWRAIPNSPAARRFHSGIPSALVASFDWSFLAFELRQKRGVAEWARTIASDHWFQKHALEALERFSRRHPGGDYTLFSYSYGALALFQFAKSKGWNTILGQIDPGLFEARIVSSLQNQNECRDVAGVAPEEYWNTWRQECQLADRIIVNSEWSRHGLVSEGVPEEKLAIVPLAYAPPPETKTWVRHYPAAFSPERPLRILFLGLVNLRKGVNDLLLTVPLVEHLPVEFWMVGPVQMTIPASLERHPKVKWFGTVSRSETMRYYREADVFLFPTHSDGFGLTQLEAMAWKLPAIASRNCAEVFTHLRNGFILDRVESSSIADAILWFLEDTQRLDSMARACIMDEQFTLAHLSTRLMAIGDSLKMSGNAAPRERTPA